MISQMNNAVLKGAYANDLKKSKESKKSSSTVSKQGDTSKIERIKEALDSGEYKVNLQALSEKIADELL